MTVYQGRPLRQVDPNHMIDVSEGRYLRYLVQAMTDKLTWDAMGIADDMLLHVVESLKLPRTTSQLIYRDNMYGLGFTGTNERYILTSSQWRSVRESLEFVDMVAEDRKTLINMFMDRFMEVAKVTQGCVMPSYILPEFLIDAWKLDKIQDGDPHPIPLEDYRDHEEYYRLLDWYFLMKLMR